MGVVRVPGTGRPVRFNIHWLPLQSLAVKTNCQAPPVVQWISSLFALNGIGRLQGLCFYLGGKTKLSAGL